MHQHPRALGLAPRSTVVSAIDIAARRPVQPVTLVRPHAAGRAARFFVEKFQGRSLYAVKANPSPELIRTLWDNGITHYDVASIAEVRLVAETLGGQATLCFMHPVKAEEAIREAYAEYGVRTFSLDSIEELEKIVQATSDAEGEPTTDLTLCVRMRVSSAFVSTPASRAELCLIFLGREDFYTLYMDLLHIVVVFVVLGVASTVRSGRIEVEEAHASGTVFPPNTKEVIVHVLPATVGASSRNSRFRRTKA